MSYLDQLTVALALFAVVLVLFGAWSEREFRKAREEQEAREAAARHAAE